MTAAGLTPRDLELIRTAVEPARIKVVWTGDATATDIAHDLVIADPEAPESVDQVKQLLQDEGIIFRPW